MSTAYTRLRWRATRYSRFAFVIVTLAALVYTCIVITSFAIGLCAAPTYAQFASADDHAYCTKNAAIFADTREADAYAEQTGGSIFDGTNVCLYYVGMARYKQERHTIPSLRPSVHASSQSARSLGETLMNPVVGVTTSLLKRVCGCPSPRLHSMTSAPLPEIASTEFLSHLLASVNRAEQDSL